MSWMSRLKHIVISILLFLLSYFGFWYSNGFLIYNEHESYLSPAVMIACTYLIIQEIRALRPPQEQKKPDKKPTNNDKWMS